MDTAVCNHCGEEKPVNKFNWRYKRKGIRQPTCRACQKKQKNRWYQRNKETHKANTWERKQRLREVARKFVWEYLSTHPCVDCGERDPVVLQFDHVRGRKRKEVANMAQEGYSIEAIQKEIGKCVVRCANCHIRKTQKERGWWRG